jgi:Pyruvate/2-oxoacid:ferredoxin oxidoreductase delta subunit
MNENDVYVQLAGKVQMPTSRWIPMILKKLITPEEGQMLLELPLSVSEFADKYQLDAAEAERKLEEFADKGVCLPLEKKGVLRYFCVSNVIQVHDATIHGALNKNYSPIPFDIIEMWRRFRETEWFEMLKMMEHMPSANRGRCIPSWSTVKDTPELTDVENLKTILKNAPAIAVVDCPCRWLQVQEGTCDKPTFTCLSLTKGSVKYILDRKIGKALTLEEGYELLDECEKAGLIPTAGGGGGQPKQLCMCTVSECIILRAQVMYGYDLWNRSRFDATVDADTCEGCETCVDRCLLSAIHMENNIAAVDPAKCFGCGVCAVTCPADAINMALKRPVSYLEKGEL